MKLSGILESLQRCRLQAQIIPNHQIDPKRAFRSPGAFSTILSTEKLLWESFLRGKSKTFLMSRAELEILGEEGMLELPQRKVNWKLLLEGLELVSREGGGTLWTERSPQG